MKAVDEFVSNTEIVERIKDIISPKIGNKKVFDKDIAALMGMNYYTFVSAKTKNYSVFHDAVLKLCARTGLNPMKLLF